MKAAIPKKSLPLIEKLIEHNVSFGPNENSDDVYENFTLEERRELRDLLHKHIKSSTDNFLHSFMSNSYVTYDTVRPDEKFEILQKIYLKLSEKPMIKILMEFIGASKQFQLIYDFKHTTVCHMDPCTGSESISVFYPKMCRIYVAAYNLLDQATEDEVCGSLVKELCHLACYICFENGCKPYAKSDRGRQESYKEIYELVKAKKDENEKIAEVFNFYPEDHLEGMIIAQVPYFYGLYSNEPDKLKEVRMKYLKLFHFYETTLTVDFKKMTSKILDRKDTRVYMQEKEMQRIKVWFLVAVIVGLLAMLSIALTRQCVVY